MNKWLSILLTVILMTAAIPSAYAEETAEGGDIYQYFPADVEGHWASEVLSDFVQAGVLKGYNKDGEVYLKPNDAVTRAEFVTILLRAVDSAAPETLKDNTFIDVKKSDWYYSAVIEASSLGIVNGVDTAHFAPNGRITRAEISAILSRFFNATVQFEGTPVAFNDISGYWAQEDIEKLSKAGIASGYKDGGFHPRATATRAEAATFLNRSLHLESTLTPEDSVLVVLVKQHIQEQFDAFKNGDFDQMQIGIEKNEVGFARDLELLAVEEMRAYQDMGLTMEVTMKGEMNGQVTSKSDRYAVVDMTGGTIELTISQGTDSYTMSSAGDDTYYLRKTQDGWKIYSTAGEYSEASEL
ncbi:S-layer homology domain-containing protein [Paenibacillus sp. YPG26]|uniref:S-layer homology domain-containing protein n=1 Tax=Paenibacillus sp. YPG26 TaxID=2878915 RepID=UPI00203FF07D|nr:S-layer homology domain-containing protein [Paenibacillus sp. YPG26]USB33566.1 S-layer homology domain-containing protein [Paenibacillus sp. YPG26]